METSGSRVDRGRYREFALIVFDWVSYAIALTVVLALLAMTVGITTGGGFVRGKHLLFVFAWVVMAYGTFKLWPRKSTAIGEARNQSQTGEEIGWFHKRVQLAPPNRWIPEPHPARRVSIGAKLFVTSLLMFGISFLLEVGFDIA